MLNRASTAYILQFGGVVRLFEKLLERSELPRDSVYMHLKSITLKLKNNDNDFNQLEKSLIPLFGLMATLLAQALIEESVNPELKKQFTNDLIDFESFLCIYSSIELSVTADY